MLIEKGLTISILGILIVFLGLTFISLVIYLKSYFFQKKSTIRVKDLNENKYKKVRVTDEVSVAISLALYFNDLFNKSLQDEVTIQKITPPQSAWVLKNKIIENSKKVFSYRRNGR